jgi:hypothetical protein
MPQPYLTVNKEAEGHVDFRPESIQSRPELAARIACCIANWSYVEMSIGRLLSFMMGVKSEVGMAMYTSLAGSAAQDSVLEAVAQNYFSLEELDVFRAIKKCSDSPQKQRNYLAHGLWGINELMPDALVWLQPKEGLKTAAEIFGVVAQQIVAKSRGEPSFETPISGLSLEHVMVYRASDFDSLEREMASVRGYWDRLLRYRYGRAVFPEQTAQYVQEFETLCNEPPIREVVERIRKSRQNDRAKFSR